ncbi:putative cytolysin/lectin [Helianthus anomalus]
MGTNVFGKPVTKGNRMERALEALNNPNADGKRNQALAYVRQMKRNWGNGVSTLGIFYNSTGEAMIFTQENSWYGRIYSSYPMRVQNGQWGAFFHVKIAGVASGSVGFVVYRVRVDDTKFCNQLISWSTPWRQSRYNNQAYCDIFDDGKVDAAYEVYQKMDAINSRQDVVTKKGMMIATKIELGTSPIYEAEFSREGC